MKQHKDILIKNLKEKSNAALDDAKLAIDNDRLDTAHNRIYYAIFYIVAALGYKQDFVTSKHAQLLGWFIKNFIKENIFDIEMGEIYKKAYENRMKSDYEFTYKPDKEKVVDLFNKSKKFIITVQDYVS
ncbi:MAG: hypothetical protein A2Y25_05140 [Candidatus Melainabacteria bacterium GWF2_37_15]|nr:MAG: hypothetical protein A2Y25_05140 [Candidatus Melainabacteria bacterium GWF2_37_15]